MLFEISDIEWDENNERHATRHGVSADEIEQMLRNGPIFRRNRKGRSGDLQAIGKTDGGRHVLAIVAWRSETRVIRPITAWELS